MSDFIHVSLNTMGENRALDLADWFFHLLKELLFKYSINVLSIHIINEKFISSGKKEMEIFTPAKCKDSNPGRASQKALRTVQPIRSQGTVIWKKNFETIWATGKIWDRGSSSSSSY